MSTVRPVPRIIPSTLSGLIVGCASAYDEVMEIRSCWNSMTDLPTSMLVSLVTINRAETIVDGDEDIHFDLHGSVCANLKGMQQAIELSQGLIDLSRRFAHDPNLRFGYEDYGGALGGESMVKFLLKRNDLASDDVVAEAFLGCTELCALEGMLVLTSSLVRNRFMEADEAEASVSDLLERNPYAQYSDRIRARESLWRPY